MSPAVRDARHLPQPTTTACNHLASNNALSPLALWPWSPHTLTPNSSLCSLSRAQPRHLPDPRVLYPLHRGRLPLGRRDRLQPRHRAGRHLVLLQEGGVGAGLAPASPLLTTIPGLTSHTRLDVSTIRALYDLRVEPARLQVRLGLLARPAHLAVRRHAPEGQADLPSAATLTQPR